MPSELLRDTDSFSAEAAAIFDSVGPERASAEGILQRFELIARPGSHLGVPLEAGDILVWRALGEGPLAGAERIVDGELVECRRSSRLAPGRYVNVHARYRRGTTLRRIADPNGRVPWDTLVIRPAPAVTGFGGDFSEVDGAEEAGQQKHHWQRLQAMAKASLALKTAGRVKLMTAIGKRFGLPEGDLSKRQSKLYRRRDVRIVGLMRRLAKEKTSKAVVANLERVERILPGTDPSLLLATASREQFSSVYARSSGKINTFEHGGLDFLWRNRRRLGLPRSVTRHWRRVAPFTNPETGNPVHPALIPARDQLLGYAAQTRLSFAGLEKYLKKQIGEEEGAKAIADLSDDARRVWKAYAFLAPGGNTFKAGRFIKQQSFGIRSAIGYLIHKAKSKGRSVDLDEILDDSTLQTKAWVRSAKTRAAEAAFMDKLLLAGLPTP